MKTKQFITLAVAAMFSLSLFAQENKGVIWENGSFNEVLAKAKKGKNKKLIFMDCYTSWCGPCKKMANEVFPTEAAGKYFNANFINAKFDMEKGEGKDLMKRFNVAAFPTFLILDADGNEIGRIVGGGQLDDFIARVEKAKNINNSPKKVKEKYDADKSVENAAAYFKALSAAYMNDESRVFAETVVDDFKAGEVLSEELWPYIRQSVNGSDKLHKFLVDNKSTASSKYGTENINSLILKTYTNKLFYYLAGYGISGKDNKDDITDDVVKCCINNIRLLANSNDYLANTCARLAELRLSGKSDDMVKMYNYRNFAHINYMQIQSIERLFAALKEVSKENIEEYYKQKKEFFERSIKDVDAWKDMFVKSKELLIK